MSCDNQIFKFTEYPSFFNTNFTIFFSFYLSIVVVYLLHFLPSPKVLRQHWPCPGSRPGSGSEKEDDGLSTAPAPGLGSDYPALWPVILRHPASLTPRQRARLLRNDIHPNIGLQAQIFFGDSSWRAGVAIKCSDFLAPARIDCHYQTRGKSLKNCCQART